MDKSMRLLFSHVCTGCHQKIGTGMFLRCMGSMWHPQCFRCSACKQPIPGYEFAVLSNGPYDKECYKELFHPRCEVCNQFVPSNKTGLVEYRAHPFWGQRYCPDHEDDGTPRCCSCERMESRDKFVSLDDGRKLCPICLDSAIMDTQELQPLCQEILAFYNGLNMRISQQVPMLLVERQALDEAQENERDVHYHLSEIRGVCLSEEQTVTSILRKQRPATDAPFSGTRTASMQLRRYCEVTAILILYGLPRFLTGSVLTHELMHAWLRLNEFPHHLDPKVEEGICQLMAHLWLESQTNSTDGLREFFIHQIATDTSTAYGDGFRTAHQTLLQFGMTKMLCLIRLTGAFPI